MEGAYRRLGRFVDLLFEDQLIPRRRRSPKEFVGHITREKAPQSAVRTQPIDLNGSHVHGSWCCKPLG